MATVDVSLFDPQRHRIDALTKRFGDALSGFFVGAKLALQHENHAHPRLLLLSRVTPASRLGFHIYIDSNRHLSKLTSLRETQGDSHSLIRSVAS